MVRSRRSCCSGHAWSANHSSRTASRKSVIDVERSMSYFSSRSSMARYSALLLTLRRVPFGFFAALSLLGPGPGLVVILFPFCLLFASTLGGGWGVRCAGPGPCDTAHTGDTGIPSSSIRVSSRSSERQPVLEARDRRSSFLYIRTSVLVDDLRIQDFGDLIHIEGLLGGIV